jgi:hypothetical protein
MRAAGAALSLAALVAATLVCTAAATDAATEPSPPAGAAAVIEDPMAPPSVPVPPAVPPVVLEGVPDAVLDLHRASSSCEDPSNAPLSRHAPLVSAMSPVALLVAIPCTGDGREATYRLYILETGEIGGVHPLVFALPSATLGWVGTDLLRSVTVDGERRLGGIWRDAGETRCLSRGTWRWIGFAFRLERAEMGTPCDGATPRSWRPVYP